MPSSSGMRQCARELEHLCRLGKLHTAQGDKENGIIVIKYNFLVSYKE